MTTKPLPVETRIDPVYGNLTVICELTLNSRRYARCRCVCGTITNVLVNNLVRGRSRSCGARSCRIKPATPAPRRITKLLPIDELRKVWMRYHEHKETAASLAAEYDVNAHALQYVFRQLRRAGGVDSYLKARGYDDGT